MHMSRPRRFALAVLVWAVCCAILFVALDGFEDPSRPKGRVLSTDAGRRALAIATERGYRGYEVVHVARGRAGEGAAEDRWIVLLDTVPHSGFERAVVVELGLESGKLLRIRMPRR
jgi:hypothetical protein